MKLGFISKALVVSSTIAGIFIDASISPANALIMNVGGSTYDVTLTTGSFSSSQNLRSLLISQTWWGDYERSLTFANAFAAAAPPNSIENSPQLGAFFMHSDNGYGNGDKINVAYYNYATSSGTLTNDLPASNTYTFAIATAVPFEFNPTEGAALGIPLFIGLGMLRKKKLAQKSAAKKVAELVS